MRIVICGGGGLGHTCTSVLSNVKNVAVDLLTNHPESWSHDIRVNTPDKGVITGHLERISSQAEEVIPDADLILFCLPAFLVEETILRIKPFLNSRTIVGSIFGSTGFFIYAHKHLPSYTSLFAFQRVPFISRIVKYGLEANLLGYRDKLIVAMENMKDKKRFIQQLEYYFGEPVVLCDHFYEVTLSNSNPILHTGRLFTMWKDWNGTPYERCSLFYREWTIDASQLDIEMDKEFFHLLEALHVKTTYIETLLDHYESTDAESMTAKLRDIPSLSTILSPMKQTEKGWIPDVGSRYFTEDFSFGLRFILETAKENGIEMPYIEMVYQWGTEMIQKHFST